MEFWLDTTKLDVIESADRLGVLFGATTNPSIISKSGERLEDVLRSILSVQEGPVTAQVVAKDAEGMIQQAKLLRKLSKRIIIKIPVTKAGLEATAFLSSRNIPTMVTVVFDSNQVVMAALAGATYVAPYLGRIQKSGKDSLKVLRDMQSIIDNQSFSTKIIAASIKSPDIVSECARLSVSAVTVPESVFKKMLPHSQTTAGIEKFSDDWKKAKRSDLF